MKSRASVRVAVLAALLAAGTFGNAAAETKDDPLLYAVFLDEVEWRGDAAWHAQAWIGHDLNKVWIGVEGEPGTLDGHRQEFRLYYGRAVSPYWDVVGGWRGDSGPARRGWLALGIRGLAPYFIEVEAEVFAGREGRAGARIILEQEWLLTQRITLVPEVEMQAFRSTDPEFGVGAGVSELKAALRVHYAIRRNFAPYVGVFWKGAFGDTATLSRDAGHESREVEFVIGISTFF